MRVQELRAALGHRPFLPFRVVLTDGASFEVRHPELCMIGVHGSAIFGMPRAGATEPFYERYTIIDLSHIIRIEPVASSVPGNGSVGT